MQYNTCSTCQGDGEQVQHSYIVICSTCGGSGYILSDPQNLEDAPSFVLIEQFAFSLVHSLLEENLPAL